MDVDGLGEKFIEVLVDSGVVQGVADLYLLNVDQLLQLRLISTADSPHAFLREAREHLAAGAYAQVEQTMVGIGVDLAGVQPAPQRGDVAAFNPAAATASGMRPGLAPGMGSGSGSGDDDGDGRVRVGGDEERESLLAEFGGAAGGEATALGLR